ncbi:MAG TPA: lipopolysaccharide kinase InaA family protein [Anaerohalosphaeraceae bacterium]|jgi:serine/threonine protein kinase|nr:lipopolysaccharide kinase InaA family protein [Anaerohalosphaeraceae bacterium]HRT86816.1 lipopolysaccharide kinase InaA family protein [Anaerohalosphaeraceae bacterium]
MTNASTRVQTPIPTARLQLADGWRIWAVLKDSQGNDLAGSDWQQIFKDLESAEGGMILKSDGHSSVIARTIQLGSRKIPLVVKRHRRPPGLRKSLRWLRPARAFRTFRTALLLQRMGIASEYPLAAGEQRKGLCASQWVYISTYVEDGRNLYYFVRDDVRTYGRHEATCRRSLAQQIAEVLAGLHNNGLWHRDAKAGNFLVRPSQDGRCEVTLVDLDGIKPYSIDRRRSRFRSLVKLAATLLCHRSVYRSDYWRTFSIYCDLTGLAACRRRLFRELSSQAIAMRLLTLATSAMDGRGVFVETK